MAASLAEITQQVVSLTTEVATLTSRLAAAEQAAQGSQKGFGKGGGGGHGGSGVFDKKRLYPKDLKDTTPFRSWADRFIAWIGMDNREIATAFARAAKQEGKLDLAGLTEEQVSYSRAIYGHLRALTEGFKRASKIVRLVKEDNGLEAWRRLVRRFDPQNPQVHAMQLQHLIMWGANHAVKSVADVPQALDQFERAMDDYHDVTGEEGINEGTRKTIMMQLLPAALVKATLDTVQAMQKDIKTISWTLLSTTICQRCEFDEAAMGSAVPMEFNAVGDEEREDAGSLRQRAVGPGLGKGGGGGGHVPGPPTRAKLPPGGTGGWEKYDYKINNGFPAGTCGGCGEAGHYRIQCPLNPRKGQSTKGGGWQTKGGKARQGRAKAKARPIGSKA